MNPLFNTTPVHQHDCSVCNFYGHTMLEGDIADMYHCPQSGSLIIRYGDMGDYVSTESNRVEYYPVDHPFRLLALLVDMFKDEMPVYTKDELEHKIKQMDESVEDALYGEHGSTFHIEHMTYIQMLRDGRYFGDVDVNSA